MPQINISLDDKKASFILSGNLTEVLSDKSIKFYLKYSLNADFSDENRILIGFEQGNKEDILKRIHELLSRYSVTETHSKDVENDLQEYFVEEKNFKEFSNKAKLIRNNLCDKTDFKEFTDILNKKLVRTLYPLQLLSAYHLTFSQNACNFSVPGSGKTSIVYGAYTYLKNLSSDNPKHVNKLLIVGPLSSFGPWESEYEECFGKRPSSKRLHGSLSKEEKRNYLYSSHISEITLISYQGVPNLKEDLVSFLKRNKVMVVLDEAHKIKNVDGGIIANEILSLAKHSKSRVILTGTPLPNGFEDLHNLYRFIWPMKEIIPFYPYQLKEMSKNLSDRRIKQLIDAVSPFFIRIRKSDLKIPKPIENPPITVSMGSAQRKIYDFIEKKYMDYFQNESDDGSFVC